MISILGWVKGAVTAVAALARAILKYIGYWFAFRLGKKKAELETERKVHAARDRQIEIAAQPASHRNDILDRMRENEL